MPSSFIDAGTVTSTDTLALLQLKRDNITPVRLSSNPNAVLHTRFGSYPHKTLLNVPWGSQVLASRTSQPSGRTRKRRKVEVGHDESEGGDEKQDELVILGPAAAGFAHVLPPTPELWTRSLPHRTQVVYTPDYSYILQRLRVRPGSVVIEAGAGSGSFTHAAARAVYNGSIKKSETSGDTEGNAALVDGGTGRVYSYEYHKPRAEQLQEEIRDHGFEDVVTITHRDVYEDGFIVGADAQRPQANAVFLDLPAPWLALRHLTRSLTPARVSSSTNDVEMNDAPGTYSSSSPLALQQTVYICTFSPCIEQVQQTVSALTTQGWTSIETVTLAHHDIIARRERIGVAEEGSRDGNPSPASVEEAVAHLRRTRVLEEEARQRMKEREAAGDWKRGKKETTGNRQTGKEKRIAELEKGREGRKPWKEGRMVTRTESELKGHTSFLTFAVLPREWSEADEEAARRKVEREHPVQEFTGPKKGKQGKGRGWGIQPKVHQDPKASAPVEAPELTDE